MTDGPNCWNKHRIGLQWGLTEEQLTHGSRSCYNGIVHLLLMVSAGLQWLVAIIDYVKDINLSMENWWGDEHWQWKAHFYPMKVPPFTGCWMHPKYRHSQTNLLVQWVAARDKGGQLKPSRPGLSWLRSTGVVNKKAPLRNCRLSFPLQPWTSLLSEFPAVDITATHWVSTTMLAASC